MPVIQISKIQYRRGQKINVPLLEASEIAFTTDTGELFIGPDPSFIGPYPNSSTSNIKIMTEFDLPKQTNEIPLKTSAISQKTILSDGSDNVILMLPITSSFIAYFTFLEDATGNGQMGEIFGMCIATQVKIMIKRFPLIDASNEVIKSTRDNGVSVQNQIPKQIVTEGTLWQYTVPANTFHDDQGNQLTFSAIALDSDGNQIALPSWLSFDASTQIFSGTVPLGGADIQLQVTATDEITSASAADEFLLVVNHNPIVSNQIPDQSVGERLTLSYQIPSDTFSDPETDADFQGETLSYAAAIVNADGSTTNLPDWQGGWLSFSVDTFSGNVPSGTPDFTVRVYCYDGFGGSVYDDFKWTVIPNHDPVLNTPLTNQVATVGVFWTYQIPANTFSDPDNDILTYSAQQIDSNGNHSNIPSWMNFDNSSLICSGTPDSAAVTVDIRIYANDNRGAPNDTNDPATADFTVTINHPPVVNIQPQDYIYNVEDTVNITLDPETFIDPDGDTLTYTAFQVIYNIQSSLPPWLSFTASSLTFTGVIPGNSILEIIPSDNQSRIIRIIANDGRGGIKNADFHLTINTIIDRLSFYGTVNTETNMIEIHAILTTDSNDGSFGSDGVMSIFMNHW